MKISTFVAMLFLALAWNVQNAFAYGNEVNLCSTGENPHKAKVGGQPESVLLYNDLLLASNMGKGSHDEKGDGYISRLGIGGQILEQKWLPIQGGILNNPLGMAILNNHLYVADIDRIAVFDINTRQALPAIDLSSTGATFLNDIVAGDAPYIYVSATGLKKIFRVNTETGEFKSIANTAALSVPNGLVWSSTRKWLYVAQNEVHSFPQEGLKNGSVIILDARDNHKVIKTSEKFGNFIDGIALTQNEEVLVSDWHSFTDLGQLYRLSNSLEIKGAENFASNGFADFANNVSGECIIAPDLLSGEIIFSKRQ